MCWPLRALLHQRFVIFVSAERNSAMHCNGMKAKCVVSCIVLSSKCCITLGVHYFVSGDKYESGTNELSELHFST